MKKSILGVMAAMLIACLSCTAMAGSNGDVAPKAKAEKVVNVVADASYAVEQVAVVEVSQEAVAGVAIAVDARPVVFTVVALEASRAVTRYGIDVLSIDNERITSTNDIPIVST